MGTLGRRLERLERRRGSPVACPEHATASPYRDYRDGLAPFLPPEMAATLGAAEAPAACGRCGGGWEPAFDVETRAEWGQHATE